MSITSCADRTTLNIRKSSILPSKYVVIELLSPAPTIKSFADAAKVPDKLHAQGKRIPLRYDLRFIPSNVKATCCHWPVTSWTSCESNSTFAEFQTAR